MRSDANRLVIHIGATIVLLGAFLCVPCRHKNKNLRLRRLRRFLRRRPERMSESQFAPDVCLTGNRTLSPSNKSFWSKARASCR